MSATTWKSRRMKVGGAFVAGFALLALVGPWLVRDPSEPLGLPWAPPSTKFWLGTTGMGQDAFAQLVAGARPTLLMAFTVGLAVTVLGGLVGVGAAVLGGKWDAALGFVIDIFLVLPGLPLVVVVGAYLGGSPVVVGLVLLLTGWAWPARVLRALAVSLRQREFVAAAIVMGENRARIMISEILPNMLPLFGSSLVTAVTYTMGALVGLEFLGLGDIERVTWGTILYWARNDVALITGSWWTFVPVGLCVGVLGFALTLLGSAFDELANPRLRLAAPFLRAVGGKAHALSPTPVIGGPP